MNNPCRYQLRIGFCFLAVLLLTLICSPATSSWARSSQGSCFGAEDEFEKVNPVLNESHEVPVDLIIFSGLTRFDENNRPAPDLATEGPSARTC